MIDRNGYWVLNGREPVRATQEEWAEMFEDINRRRVDLTTGPGWWVSTVFLGRDQGIDSEEPLLFETMIFSENSREYEHQTRASTWAEAKAQHAEAVAIAQAPEPSMTEMTDRQEMDYLNLLSQALFVINTSHAEAAAAGNPWEEGCYALKVRDRLRFALKSLPLLDLTTGEPNVRDTQTSAAQLPDDDGAPG